MDLGIGMCLECGGGPGNSWEVTEDHSEPESVTADLHLEMWKSLGKEF